MFNRIKGPIGLWIFLLVLSSTAEVLYALPYTYSSNGYTLFINSIPERPLANTDTIYNLKIIKDPAVHSERSTYLMFYAYMENLHAGHNMPGMQGMIHQQLITDFKPKTSNIEYEAIIVFPMEGEWKTKVSGKIDDTPMEYIFSNTVLPKAMEASAVKTAVITSERDWVYNGVSLAAFIVIFFMISSNKQNTKLKEKNNKTVDNDI